MQRLGDILLAWRVHRQLGLREAAEMIGIGHTTLHRVEHGEMPDGVTLKRIICWLLEAKDE